MIQNCWGLWADRGFLIAPDPVEKVSTTISEAFPAAREQLEHLESIAADLPRLVDGGTVRATLDQLPIYDFGAVRHLSKDLGALHLERLMQIYSYFASSYIHGVPNDTGNRIPPGVAVPLVALAQMVERPPILSYSNYVLNNWRKIDPNGGIVVDNLDTIQSFLGSVDEKWFVLIHVDIEARATAALRGMAAAAKAVKADDTGGLEAELTHIIDSLRGMIATFERMPEHCNSDVYYFKVRPYIFGFTDVVYEGVKAYSGAPQSFRGQTGAQSSIIPAMVAAFGLQHEQTGLTHHLEIMKAYMPRPHRDFIDQMSSAGIREFVLNAHHSTLNELYNECLRLMTEFRKLHYHYATTYIAQKVSNPLGTGGTIFMDWLNQLITETENQRMPVSVR